MENKNSQKERPVNMAVKFDSQVLEANTAEKIIEQLSDLVKKHPNATFCVAGIATWWTISDL